MNARKIVIDGENVRIQYCKWFADQKHVFICGYNDHGCKVYIGNAKTLKCFKSFQLKHNTSIAFCARLQQFAYVSLSCIYLHSVHGKRLKTFTSPDKTKWFHLVEFSTTKNLLASVCDKNKIIIWHLHDNKTQYRQWQCTDWITRIRFSQNGENLIAVTVFGYIFIYNIEQNSCVCNIEFGKSLISVLCFQDETKLVLCGREAKYIFDLTNKTTTKTIAWQGSTLLRKNDIFVTRNTMGKTENSAGESKHFFDIIYENQVIRSVPLGFGISCESFDINKYTVMIGQTDGAVQFYRLFNMPYWKPFLLLLNSNITLYIVLDILNMLIAAKESTSFEAESKLLHFEKVSFLLQCQTYTTTKKNCRDIVQRTTTKFSTFSI